MTFPKLKLYCDNASLEVSRGDDSLQRDLICVAISAGLNRQVAWLTTRQARAVVQILNETIEDIGIPDFLGVD